MDIIQFALLRVFLRFSNVLVMPSFMRAQCIAVKVSGTIL